MSARPLLDPKWQPRDPPLTPEVVVGMGHTALRLASHLLAMEPQRRSLLIAAASASPSAEGKETALFAVLGPVATLPWVNGVQYFGRTSEAPSLFQPTNRRPTVPDSLLEELILKRATVCPPPVLLMPDLAALVSVASARAIDLGRLQEWLEAAP